MSRPVAVVIPALNEEDNIAGLVAELSSHALVDFVVVVDNGSEDNTGAAAEAAGAVVVSEARRGYGWACASGAGHSQALGAEVIAFIDADGSSLPAEIAKVLAPILDGRAELVLGSRVLGGIESGAMRIHQRFGNWLSAGLMRRLYDVSVTDLGPFRAITSDLLTRLDMTEMTFGWPTEMTVKAARSGAVILEVPTSWHQRAAGESKISGTVKGSVLAGYYILGVTIKHRKWLPAD